MPAAADTTPMIHLSTFQTSTAVPCQPKPVAMAAGTTLAAQCGVSPLLLFHFHEVPLVTILANLLAFPAVSPALLVGLAAGAVGVAVRPVGALIAKLALLPLRYLETVADRLAKAPVAWVTSGGGIGPLRGRRRQHDRQQRAQVRRSHRIPIAVKMTP